MATSRNDYTLYEKPFSSIMLALLSVIVGANFILLGLAFAALIIVGVEHRELTYPDVGRAAPLFVNVLYWLLTPFVVFAISCLDLYKLRRQTLRPLRLLITASICMVSLIILLSLWLPCTFQSYWYHYWDAYEIYCPYSNTLFAEVYNVVPLFGFAPLMCYGLYVILAIVAFRHSLQTERNTLEETQQHELKPPNRYKLASGVYTDVDDSASDSLPSTFHGNLASPAPTAHPPSYVTREPGGPPSRRASSFFSEMSHWRRDVEMASISGTSHMCTCQCHDHHIVPAEQISEEPSTAVD